MIINHLAICGLGKLGSPIAASFARAGLNVIGYDLDEEKVNALIRGLAPVDELGLQEAISACRSHLTATPSASMAVAGSDACIFVTPTPSLPDGSFSNQYLLAGIGKIAPAVGDRDYIFIIASTVTPGSCENILLPAIRLHSEKIRLVYKPEFIALGTVMHDLANPDVGLIGAADDRTSADVFLLYARLQQGLNSHECVEFKMMTLLEAELAKISLNCAITMKISFANQVSMVAQQLGANAHTILDFVGRDSRVGKKALRPGMPFGGPCFPRDNRMFQYAAKKVGIIPHLAMATDWINEDMLRYILRCIPENGDIGILGLAYKAGTAITEESAGIALKTALMDSGRTVKVHDPLVSPQGLEEVLACRTIVITTDCAEYRALEFGPGKTLIDPLCITETQKEFAANAD